ncbi:MAG: phage portal protein [Mycolicibacterium cosmeticum]|nr:phage portal protein [Mycolicibacterium cosmeticum]
MTEILDELLENLDSRQGPYNHLEAYASGTQKLAWISPESRKAMGDRLTHLSSNIPSLLANSIVERLRINGFSDPRAWNVFTATDLDQLAPRAMLDSLIYGTGYVLVWTKAGKVVASVESPRQCAVLRDPADRSVVAGVKRYTTKHDGTHAYLYLPDVIEHWRSPASGAARNGFALVDQVVNPLGTVPLVPIENGYSEFRDVIPLTDALVKLLVDMMTASEAAGKPRRWIAGLEFVEKPRLDQDGNSVVDDNGEPIIDVVSPIDDVNTTQTMLSENADTKFGQLPASDLSGFKEGVQVIVSQLSAVSSLPAHYLSPLTAAQVPSADGLRAAEASLIARCESKQLKFGRAFEQVARLLVALDTGQDPAGIDGLRVKWADASTRSVAQEADAAQKLYAAKILDRRSVLRTLGYTDDEIDTIVSSLTDEAKTNKDIERGRYMDDVLSYAGVPQ